MKHCQRFRKKTVGYGKFTNEATATKDASSSIINLVDENDFTDDIEFLNSASIADQKDEIIHRMSKTFIYRQQLLQNGKDILKLFPSFYTIPKLVSIKSIVFLYFIEQDRDNKKTVRCTAEKWLISNHIFLT